MSSSQNTALEARVKELERQLTCRDTVIASAKDALKFADEAWEKAQAKASALEAILEKALHEGNEAGCYRTCVKCAYEALKKGEMAK